MKDKTFGKHVLTGKEPPFFQTPEKKEAFMTMENLLNNKLPQAKTLPEFYQFVQEMIFQINVFYENIQCKTGCSRCCKFYGSPQMFKSEWDYIRTFIDKNFGEKQKRRVFKKFKENIDSLKESLENDIASDDVNDNFSVYVFMLSECPFLYKGSCSIYEARPLICRIFGNSLAGTNQNKILTCKEEKERWDAENNTDENIFLPYQQKFEDALLQITKPEERFFNTIQYWLTEYFNEY
jgi:Fe-S-cluster containining protein